MKSKTFQQFVFILNSQIYIGKDSHIPVDFEMFSYISSQPARL